MDPHTTCADCGIRFSTELAQCPWCGAETPQPSAVEESAAAVGVEAADAEAETAETEAETAETEAEKAEAPEAEAEAPEAESPEPAAADAGEALEPDDLAVPTLTVEATSSDRFDAPPRDPAPSTPLLEVAPAEPDDLAVPGLTVEAGSAEQFQAKEPGPSATPLVEVAPAEPDDLAVPGLSVEPAAPDQLAGLESKQDAGSPAPAEDDIIAAMEEPPPHPREVSASVTKRPLTGEPPEGAPVEIIAPMQEATTPVRAQAPPAKHAEPATQAKPKQPPGDTPPPKERRRSRARTWLINGGLAVGLFVIGALIAEFAPIGNTSDTEVTTPATVAQPTTTPTPQTTAPPATTLPPATSTTTTTQATTTTTTEPPTTTTTLPPIDPIGDPIAIDDLRMGVDGLGPLALGQDGAEVVGRLVASLGQPTAQTGVITSEGEMGTCSGDSVRIVQFGSLSVINEVGDDGSEVFAAYRLLVDPDGPLYPASALKTISGVGPGDTVADLKLTYSTLVIEFVEAAEGDIFELRRGSDRGLLLWGPVTSVDDAGLISGIYSVDACST